MNVDYGVETARDEIRLGSVVQCGETAVGTLEWVVLDPATQQIMHLVINRGRFPHRAVVAPAEAAAQAAHRAPGVRAVHNRLAVELPDVA